MLINAALKYTPHHGAAFIRIIDSKSTQRSLLRSQLEILTETDTQILFNALVLMSIRSLLLLCIAAVLTCKL